MKWYNYLPRRVTEAGVTQATAASCGCTQDDII